MNIPNSIDVIQEWRTKGIRPGSPPTGSVRRPPDELGGLSQRRAQPHEHALTAQRVGEPSAAGATEKAPRGASQPVHQFGPKSPPVTGGAGVARGSQAPNTPSVEPQPIKISNLIER
ncbi:hypothetical protein H106_05691 [Trichophyton rubrum CBS 735.88]|uniref:Uncharacterized protein n=1 Tax=Trichophyton rubrum (strain ATCC MYA-4607 / CBS 118892) TaxID=559305 RepID=A0A080WSU8_TRIRC|nr:uncharacterized protein TERG_12013 [Trichophyton rubrum CBS 118892]EZG04825.1 hypothetical protein H106_05691 [Trichophyton rubrum CBS 735.88]KFL61238.1 hypothetical protein TERG_12013 [Trichophyton rubrum CBS 118892]